MKDTSLSSVKETFKTLFGKQSKSCSSFIALLSKIEHGVSCTINTDDELLMFCWCFQ